MTRMAHPVVVIRRTLDVLLLVLVLVCVVGIALARIVPLTGRETFVVGGPSMEPAIPLGAAVVVEPVAPAALAVGDVVSLRSGPGRAVFTHRIVRLAQRDGEIWIETKGDANRTPDPSLTPASAVIGRAAFVVPWAGYLIALLSHPVGALAFITLGLLLLTAAWLVESFEPATSVPPVDPAPRPTVPADVMGLRDRRLRRARWMADRRSHPQGS
jgi:signal peptidase I